MKNFARCLVMLLLMNMSSIIYAQEWIPYNQYIQPQPQVQTVYIQSQPVIVYQLVPYVVNQNIIVERRCFFHINQTVIAKPTVQWVYQPVVYYK